MNLYLTSSGRLSRKSNSLQLELADGEKRGIPIEKTEDILAFGKLDLNTDTLNFLAKKGITLHTFNWHGTHTGSFLPHAPNISGDVVVAQVMAHRNIKHRTAICKEIVSSVIHNAKKVIEERIGTPEREKLEQFVPLLENAKTPEEVMGVEGQMRKTYYTLWEPILHESFSRNYNPPSNPANALLSFLYGLLYATTTGEIYRTHLHLGVSYLHSPQSRRISLTLDLCEPFKPIYCERMLLNMFSRNEIGPKDFISRSNGVFLNEASRKRVIEKWNDNMERTIYHGKSNQYVKRRKRIRIDAYNLQKHLLEGSQLTLYREH